MQTVSQQTALPIYQICTPPLSNPNKFRLATASLSLQSETPIDVVQVDASGLLNEESQECDVVITPLYSVPSRFPPATIQFAASKVHRYQDTLLVAGEGLTIWRDGSVIAYHTPPPTVPTHRSKRPAWTLLHAQWSEYKPDSILTCQRNGQLCLYPVERLNNTLHAETGEPRGFLSRLFSSATTRKPQGADYSSTSSSQAIVMAAPQRSAPTHTVLQQCAPNLHYTYATFINSHQIVASRSDNDQLTMIDLRSPPSSPQVQPWTATQLRPTKIVSDPFLHPNLLCTLDRQNAVVTLWDTRNLDYPIKSLTSQQLTGYDCLINDVWWEPGYTGKTSLTNGLIYVACQARYGSSGPVPLIQVVDVATLASPDLPHLVQPWEEPSPPSLENISSAMTVLTIDDSIAVYTTAVYNPASQQSLCPTPYTEESSRTEDFYEASSWELHIASIRHQAAPRRGSVCTRLDFPLQTLDEGGDSSVAVIPSNSSKASLDR